MSFTLVEDLQRPKPNLEEFKTVTVRVLNYITDVINEEVEYQNYLICASTIAGNRKRIRPFNKRLFIRSVEEFSNEFSDFEDVMTKLQNGIRTFEDDEFYKIDRVIYTIQQSIGIGLDLLADPNSSRKHVGTRFEELIRALLGAIGISLQKIVLSIPYDTDEGQK